MTRTREERETVIRFDETNERAYLSTFSPSQAHRWGRAGVELTQRGGEWIGRADKRWIRLRKPRTLCLTQGRRDEIVAALARGRARRIRSADAET